MQNVVKGKPSTTLHKLHCIRSKKKRKWKQGKSSVAFAESSDMNEVEEANKILTKIILSIWGKTIPKPYLLSFGGVSERRGSRGLLYRMLVHAVGGKK
jgi:hypothetical protein